MQGSGRFYELYLFTVLFVAECCEDWLLLNNCIHDFRPTNRFDVGESYGHVIATSFLLFMIVCRK
jgi:hypothetical protein